MEENETGITENCCAGECEEQKNPCTQGARRTIKTSDAGRSAEPINRKYRKKPVEIEAVQLNWKNWNEICEFLAGIISEDNPGRYATGYSDDCGEPGPEYISLTIPTLEGDHLAKHGDFIIKGIQGEFYPCKPDVFAKSYDVVEDGNKYPGGPQGTV